MKLSLRKVGEQTFFLHFEAAVQKTVNDLKNKIGRHFSILCNTSHLRVAMVIKTIIMF